jgi:glycyl-tRNA synthetase (class II)
VTVRDRDSLAQERLPISGVREWLDDALQQDWSSPHSR